VVNRLIGLCTASVCDHPFVDDRTRQRFRGARPLGRRHRQDRQGRDKPAAEILRGAGFPAAEGWYATITAPNILESPDAAPVIERFAKKYGQQPENYSITA
jgi:hypothetical protein